MSKSKTDKEKGDEYELFIFNYLKETFINAKIWMWKDVPKNELKLLGFNVNSKSKKNRNINPNPDTGIDILMLDNNKCYFIQCKNYYKNNVGINKLKSFYYMMFEHEKIIAEQNLILEGIVYYTHNNVSTNLKTNKHRNDVQFICKSMEYIIEKSYEELRYINYLEERQKHFYDFEQTEEWKDLMKRFSIFTVRDYDF